MQKFAISLAITLIVSVQAGAYRVTCPTKITFVKAEKDPNYLDGRMRYLYEAYAEGDKPVRLSRWSEKKFEERELQNLKPVARLSPQNQGYCTYYYPLFMAMDSPELTNCRLETKSGEDRLICGAEASIYNVTCPSKIAFTMMEKDPNYLDGKWRYHYEASAEGDKSIRLSSWFEKKFEEKELQNLKPVAQLTPQNEGYCMYYYPLFMALKSPELTHCRLRPQVGDAELTCGVGN